MPTVLHAARRARRHDRHRLRWGRDVAIADLPERKADVVFGTYELPERDASAPVAVKVTDMLGEEVLVVLDR